MAEKLEIIISAKDKTKGTFGGLKNTLGSLAKFGAAAAVTGIGALATATAGLTVGLIALSKQAAKVGPIKDAFDAVASPDLLNALQKSAKGMISNTDLMTQYNNAAMLVGKQFADELPEAMKYLTKVSGATGKDMSYLTESLVTGIGRQSKVWLDNLGIIVDVEKAHQDYAVTLGKEVDDLTEVEQKAGLVAQVYGLLEENTKNLAEVSDPFQRLAATWDNLKDKAALVIGGTMLPLVESLSLRISEFVESEEFKAWLESTAEWIEVELIPKLVNLGTEIGENLPAYIASLQGAWAEFQPSLVEMKTSFDNVAKSVRELFAWIGWAIDRYNTWNTMLFTGGMTSWTSTGRPPGSKRKKPPGYNVEDIQTYQHGGSFMVGGPSGIDRTPVSFMATRGERVDITPRGGGGGINFTYAPAFSLGNREEFETVIIPMLRDAVR